jgi:hypothetical protein
MSTVQSPIRVLEEIADLFASGPGRDEVLNFRLSSSTEQRARELLEREREGSLSFDERRELDQFEQAELLMRLVKARLRAQAEP